MEWLQDVRYAVRALGKSRGVVLLVILNLAFGIAGSTAIFSLLYGVALAPLPFSEADRLMRLCEVHESVGSSCVTSVPDLTDLAERGHSFETLGAGRLWPMLLRTVEGPKGISGALVLPGFLSALRIKPFLGRLIEPGDIGVGRPKVAVLDYRFWETWAGRDPAVLGRSISLDNELYTVVGVLPPVSVPELEKAKVWVPLPFDPRNEENRAWRGFIGLGRLKPRVEEREAQKELEGLVAQLAREHPDNFKGWGIKIVSLREQWLGPVRFMLVLFLSAVALVLLIACINAANLLLARATSRQREIAVRASIGATRFRLIRYLLTESLILALAAGIVGIGLAGWILKAFLPLAPAGIPRLDEVSINGWVLVFAILVSFASSVLSGLWPAYRTVHMDLTQCLKQAGPMALGSSAFRVRSLLVLAEVALGLVLLIGAGLLTRSLTAARLWNGGFEHEHLLTLWLLPLESKYPDKPRVAALYQQAEQAVAGLPSVVSVGAASAGPLFGGRETEAFLPEGWTREPVVARWYDVGPRFFQTLGLPLRQGRYFVNQDVEGAPRVAIVNETFVQRVWPGENPIGKRVRGTQDHPVPMEVVGVVKDVKPLTPGGEKEPEIYWPYPQEPRWATYLLVRTASDPAGISGAVRRRLRQVDPDLDVEQVATFSDLMKKQLSGAVFQATLAGTFAVIALIMVIGGTYGVLSHTVAQQTREIGLRMALGAQRRDVLRQVIGRALRMVGAGVIVGLLVSAALTRVLSSLLYGVAPTDPASFLAMTGVLVAIALLAAYFPARRATRIDPLIAIRHD